jgi:hypothetical protein
MNPGEPVPLAVVVPAHRERFFDATLRSLSLQTNKQFRVYVGNDGGPQSLGGLADKYARDLDLVYHRFEENVGGKSLVAHWRRCVALSHEPWVWLFSDDDEMEPGCVQAWLACLTETGGRYDIYRFDCVETDTEGTPTALHVAHPPVESFKTCAYHLLRRTKNSVQQCLVFSRKAYDEKGGFQDFPLAWCSDHAFAIQMGTPKGIRRVEGAQVRFRQSGANISTGFKKPEMRRKHEANMRFVRWLSRHIASHSDPDFGLTDEILRDAMRQWFLMTLHCYINPFDRRQCQDVSRLLQEEFGYSRFAGNATMAKAMALSIVRDVVKGLG